MLTPSLKALASTCEGIMLLWRASCTRFCRPFMRFRPPVSRILRTAAGLPSTQLLGARASVTSEAKNCARPFSLALAEEWAMNSD